MKTADLLLEIRKKSHGITLLYVEDNETLRNRVHKLFKNFFKNIILASDGEEGYMLFNKHRPQLIVTDINMPKLTGIEMIHKIKQLDSSVECIILSAYDEKKNLLDAIKNGVSDYLTKPVKIDDLTRALTKSLNTIHKKNNSLTSDKYLKDIVNYQQNLIALVSNGKILFANKVFLSFFGMQNIKAFNTKHQSLGNLLLEQKGFLYNQPNHDWFTQVKNNIDQLFHINLNNQNGEKRHFILKMDLIPQKNNLYILSLNDITSLNLLSLFQDKTPLTSEERNKINDTIFDLLLIVHQKHSKIKIHNFYKGLTITNHGYITEVKTDQITIKTSFNQLKAIQMQDNLLISSEIFPNDIQCEKILDIDFTKQTLQCKKLYFSPINSMQRKSIRVDPAEDHNISLILNKQRFQNDISIKDISVDAIKIQCKALPVGLKVDSEAIVNIILENSKVPIKVNVSSKVLRIDEKRENFLIILLFTKISQVQKNILTTYVARRQMQLIREFKGLQYEQR